MEPLKDYRRRTLDAYDNLRQTTLTFDPKGYDQRIVSHHWRRIHRKHSSSLTERSWMYRRRWIVQVPSHVPLVDEAR